MKKILTAAIALLTLAVIPAPAQTPEKEECVSIDEIVEAIRGMSEKIDTEGIPVCCLQKTAVSYCMVGEEYTRAGQYFEAQAYFELASKLLPGYERADKGLIKVNKIIADAGPDILLAGE